MNIYIRKFYNKRIEMCSSKLQNFFSTTKCLTYKNKNPSDNDCSVPWTKQDFAHKPFVFVGFPFYTGSFCHPVLSSHCNIPLPSRWCLFILVYIFRVPLVRWGVILEHGIKDMFNFFFYLLKKVSKFSGGTVLQGAN